MITETRRDLSADLAIINAATDGVDMCVGDTDVRYDYWQPLLSEDEQFPVIARFEKTEDALFFCEARTAWPIAIERAINAEAEVARLRLGITRLRDRLICDLDAVGSGDTTERSAAYEDCLASTLRRIDRYTGGAADDTTQESGA